MELNSIKLSSIELNCIKLNSIEGVQIFEKVVFANNNGRTYFKQEITAQSELP